MPPYESFPGSEEDQLREKEREVVLNYLTYLKLWFLGRQFDPERAEEALDHISSLEELVRDAELL